MSESESERARESKTDREKARQTDKPNPAGAHPRESIFQHLQRESVYNVLEYASSFPDSCDTYHHTETNA